MPYTPGMEKITVSEAARLLGYQRTSVYALVKRGELRGEIVGPRSMLLDRAEVEALRDQGKRGRGRPRKTPPAEGES
jgi:excisionase family DNA binding protein